MEEEGVKQRDIETRRRNAATAAIVKKEKDPSSGANSPSQDAGAQSNYAAEPPTSFQGRGTLVGMPGIANLTAGVEWRVVMPRASSKDKRIRRNTPAVKALPRRGRPKMEGDTSSIEHVLTPAVVSSQEVTEVWLVLGRFFRLVSTRGRRRTRQRLRRRIM